MRRRRADLACPAANLSTDKRADKLYRLAVPVGGVPPHADQLRGWRARCQGRRIDRKVLVAARDLDVIGVDLQQTAHVHLMAQAGLGEEADMRVVQ